MSRIAAALLILVGAAALVAADSWSDRTREGEWAFAHGDHQHAETAFRAALDIAQRFPEGDRRLEASLTNLARLYEHELRLDEAQPLYALLVAAVEARAGDHDPALLEPLLALGRVALAAGDVPVATASLDRYLALADASHAARPEQLWRVFAMRARMEVLAERPEAGLALQRRAVAALEADPSADNEERAIALESLGGLELEHGSGEEAEKLLVRAAALRHAADPAVRVEDRLAEAAAQAFSAARPEIAEGLGKRALEAAGDAPAPLAATRALADVAWMRVGRMTSDVSLLLENARDTPELAEAARRLEDLFGAEAEAGAQGRTETARRLAAVSALRGQAGAAARWQREVVSAQPDSLEARTVEVALLTAAGRTAEALAASEALLALAEARGGPVDPALAPLLERQAALLLALGRKREAKSLSKRARRLRR